MSVRANHTIDTLLWLGAGLVAAIVAPVLLLVDRVRERRTHRR
jgi:hypothetical protein